jgi:HEPN domain-containing protein
MNGPADLARGWLLKADSDLSNARRTLEGPGPYDTACFHAQQAAERCLKAVLGYFGKAIPRTHDLDELADRAHAVAPELELDVEALAEVTPYAVELRYDLEFWPGRETASEALAVAERLRRLAAAALPPEARP